MEKYWENQKSRRVFCTTQWTIVLNAREGDKQSSEALEGLCRAYWYPLYFYVRRRGSSPEESQDLVQGFFEQFLKKDYLHSVDRGKGKFRTFLLTSLSHFLANEWDKKSRLKRGGGQSTFSIDRQEAEDRFKFEPPDSGLRPDAAFDRAWAQMVVESVFSKLRDEYAKLGEANRFEALKDALMGDVAGPAYELVGAKLGLSEGGVKTVVRRMRLRFGRLLREELAGTLADPNGAEEEMRHLLQALLA